MRNSAVILIAGIKRTSTLTLLMFLHAINYISSKLLRRPSL